MLILDQKKVQQLIVFNILTEFCCELHEGQCYTVLINEVLESSIAAVPWVSCSGCYFSFWVYQISIEFTILTH